MRNSRGFTLLEILLVLTVIPIMLGLAMVSFSSNSSREFNRELKRLHYVLQLASEESISQGVEYSLAISGNSYQILAFNQHKRQWQSVESDGMTEYQIPEYYLLDIQLDGQAVDPQVRAQLAHFTSSLASSRLQPAILLLSSGETTPFTLTLSHQDEDLSGAISSDGVSGIVIK